MAIINLTQTQCLAFSFKIQVWNSIQLEVQQQHTELIEQVGYGRGVYIALLLPGEGREVVSNRFSTQDTTWSSYDWEKILKVAHMFQ